MAKFVSADGSHGISGDAFMDQYNAEHGYCDTCLIPCTKRKYHADVDKLKIPGGRINSHRLASINDYDLLCHIQQTLSLTGKCIIEMITNEDKQCIKHSDIIAKKIRLFAERFITNELKEKYPKHKDESDESYDERLCHLIIHRDHPNKLQMIKCEECIQQWMNSDKW